MNLSDTVVLVTGANRGLGAHLVAELLGAGVPKIYAAARDTGSFDADVVADQRIHVLAVDVTKASSVTSAVAAAPDVDVLINNAGVLNFGGILDGDLDGFQANLATNYFGTLRMTRGFLPVLERNAPSTVVNVLSMLALAPFGPMAGYSASKAAAHSLTQALRAELHSRNINVLGAYPSSIDTGMLAGVAVSKVAPTVVAQRIVAALAAEESMVFPDDASQARGQIYLGDPIALERRLADIGRQRRGGEGGRRG